MSAFLRILSFVAAAVVGGLIVSYLGRAPAPAAGAMGEGGQATVASFIPGPALAPVTQMPAAERIRLGGTVEPLRVVQLTAQSPGRITYVAGFEGDRVSAGQVVVALDDAALQAQYGAAWADLSGQMAGIENAQAQLYQSLYGRSTSPMGGPAQAGYEQMTVPLYNMAQGFFNAFMPNAGGPNSPFNAPQMMTQNQAQHSYAASSAARFAYESQLSQLAAAQARIDGLDAALRDRRAVAPWQGAIMARHVRVGDMVQPGQPLAEIADVDQLTVRIEVPVAMVGNLHIGDPVPVTLGDANLWAPVAQIYPGADAGAHTVTVKLALPSGVQAAPGMYALAWIAQPGGGSPSQLAPAIPTSAVARRGSLPVAFVVTPQGRVEMRVLRLGDEQGSNTAVLSGLQAGEMVVADPTPDLKSGDLYNTR